MFKDYVMDVVVRNDNSEGGEEGTEKQFTCTNIRAHGELDARRQVLERAWGRRLIVSSITNVRVKGGKLY